MGLAGRVALVTGAARGIGAAVADRLSEQGAVVAAVDRDGAALADTVGKLRADGRGAHCYPADVADREAVETLCRRVESELGPVHALVSVAGTLRVASVADLSDADWSATFAVNTAAVFHLGRYAARTMKPRRAGVFVTVGSNAAEVPRVGMAAYAASKAAATQFTKCLGLELAPYGIRCNVVSPGSTNTEMQRTLWSGADGYARTVAGDPGAFRTGIPLGRLAEPDDVAHLVTFLASAHARHITMQNIYVDGGASLR
nr:2,3-dihydro-2,3-dihydroxybenzoate dehydrogenase [Nocardia transvalensis]